MVMVRMKAWLLGGRAPADNWRMKAKLPARVGVPLMTPEVDRDRPGGSTPPSKEKV